MFVLKKVIFLDLSEPWLHYLWPNSKPHVFRESQLVVVNATATATANAKHPQLEAQRLEAKSGLILFSFIHFSKTLVRIKLIYTHNREVMCVRINLKPLV